MRVLLVEPGYKNKYPPMGLMKISAYHKSLGDEVRFAKGIDRRLDKEVWDRIYITSLFTFHFDVVVKTINYYKFLVNDVANLYVGGVLATLMPDRLAEAAGIERSQILTGLFTDSAVVGDESGVNVDELPLDYDILEQIDYQYPAGDNYFGYTTRGCPNRCKFCAVPILEPRFHVTNNIVKQIRAIDEKFGPKRNLLLLDNNVLNVDDLNASRRSLRRRIRTRSEVRRSGRLPYRHEALSRRRTRRIFGSEVGRVFGIAKKARQISGKTRRFFATS